MNIKTGLQAWTNQQFGDDGCPKSLVSGQLLGMLLLAATLLYAVHGEYMHTVCHACEQLGHQHRSC